jgi:hypothetical protein
MEQSNENLVNEINDKLIWLMQYERENLINGNDSALKNLDTGVLDILVDYWYNFIEKEIFMNEQGIEIDEFLNVEEYKF